MTTKNISSEQRDQLANACARRRRLKGYIFVRGWTWWIAYSVNGVQHRESSHSNDCVVARALLEKKLALIEIGECVAPSKVTWDEAHS